MPTLTVKFRGLLCFVRESDRRCCVLSADVREPASLRLASTYRRRIDPHYARFLTDNEDWEMEMYPCRSAADPAKEWYCRSLHGWEVTLPVGTATLDCSGLYLPPLDELAADCGASNHTKLTPGLTTVELPSSLLSSRTVVRGGSFKIDAADGYWDKDPVGFQWIVRKYRVIREVTLTVDCAAKETIILMEGREREEFEITKAVTVVIENNCIPPSTTDPCGGELDFLAHYNLLAVPQQLIRLPSPLPPTSGSLGPANNVQCSPVEHSG